MALEIFQLAQLTLNPLNDARSRSRLGVHLNGQNHPTVTDDEVSQGTPFIFCAAHPRSTFASLVF